MKIVSKFHVPIFYTFREISRKKALQSFRAGQGRLIVLNLAMVIKMYFNFFSSLNVLDLFECRRGNPYTDANRNFVPFAHS